MNLLDIFRVLRDNFKHYMKSNDVDALRKIWNNNIMVNVNGELLPIENVRIRDGRLVLIISASALEDRFDENNQD